MVVQTVHARQENQGVRLGVVLDRVSFTLVFGAIALIGFFFLVFPTVVVLGTSFTASETLRFPPEGFSLHLYRDLLQASQMQSAALNSLVVATITTVLSVTLGVSGALAIGRSNALWARILDNVFMSPLFLPAIAFGFAALMLFSLLQVKLSLLTLLIGHTVVCVPFVIRTTVAALSQMNPALLESSQSLGASKLYTFRRVTLPIIKPGIISGAFLAFMASFDNVPVSLFLTNPRTEVLPIYLWQIINSQLDARAAAAAAFLIFFTVILLVIMERVAGVTRYMR